MIRNESLSRFGNHRSRRMAVRGSRKILTAPGRHRDIFASRVGFLIAQLVQVLLLSFFLGSGNIWAFTMSGLACVFSYGVLIRQEISRNRYVATPFLLFLISGLFRLGLVPFWALACELAGKPEAFQFTRYLVRDLIIEGQFLLVLGDVMFIAGYTAFQRFRPDVGCIRQLSTLNVGQVGYVAACISISLIVLNQVASGLMASFGRFSNFFTTYGIIGALLLMLLSRRVGRPVPWSIIGVVVGLALMNSLRSYMKQETILLMIPFALVLMPIVHRKLRSGLSAGTWCLVTGCGLMLIVGTSWLFTISQIRRSEFWVKGTSTQYRLQDSEVPVWPAAKIAAASLLPWTPEFQEYQQLPEGGLWSVFSRQADALAAGWTYREVGEHGTLGGTFIRTGLISVVPRILWSGKPEIAQGRLIAVLLGQARTEETSTTSTHVGGMASALFFDLGWTWLFVGMASSGALFALVSGIFIRRLLVNPFAAIGIISLHVQAIRHFEAAFAAGIEMYAYQLIVILPLVLAWDWIARAPK